MQHFKFSEPRGDLTLLSVLQADDVGLAGAIIKMAQDGRVAEQPVPRRVTIYYIVDSLKMVTSFTC